MGLQRSRPGYTLRVDRLMVGDSEFVIQAEVEYREGLSAQERGRLMPMAQLELLLAIEGEEERGRLLGTDVVQVVVAGDEPLYRFFSGRAKGLPARTAAPTRAGLLGRGGRPGLAAGPVQRA